MNRFIQSITQKRQLNLSPYIEWTTFSYLFCPFIIFFFGYFKTWIFLCWLILLGLLVYKNKDKLWVKRSDYSTQYSYLNLALLLMGVCLWVYYSGIGWFSFTNGDYVKHNAILYDLVSKEWPVYYHNGPEGGGKGFYLHYYFGYYLIPTVVGKWLGFLAGLRFTYFWAILGILLGLYWSFKLIGKIRPIVFVVFVFFSGWDIVGHLLMNGKIPSLGTHMEWWSGSWQFSGNSTLLYWVPQHVIPAWILTPIIMDKILQRRGESTALCWYCLTSFWSPFVMFGLLPFIFIWFIRTNIKKWFSIQNIFFAGFIFTVFGLYYFSGSLNHRSGFIWSTQNFDQHITKLLWFYLLEFINFWIFALPHFWYGKKEHKILTVSVAILLVIIPLYVFGMYNDWAMRVSIPSLFALQLLIMIQFFQYQYKGKKIALGFFALFWAIGSITCLSEITRSVKNPTARIPKRGINQMRQYQTSAQYMGIPISPFFKYLTRKPSKGYKLNPSVYKHLRLKHTPIWSEYFDK
ncbi:MAG: hypothetical protein HOE90_14625 [Bacteriovoracaceae bacterium]|jgi:hypothetical protein|nr:hypothetical protein [Bacteriovoracaceae bacterium]